ncbi:MAG TPA: hypothetical protein VK177_19745 [Flavobacteriales bacterium]|nr:hypothetical protein [Flavobacteriales bacterium]
MKKIILGLFAGCLLLAACSKEEKPATTNPSSVSSFNPFAGTRTAVNRHWFDNGAIPGVPDVDYGCTTPAVECGDDVTVVSGNQQIIDNMWTEITTQSTSHIASYFNTNASDLDDIMPLSVVNAVKNGNAVTAYRGAAPGKRFLIIKNLQGVIVAVFPYV